VQTFVPSSSEHGANSEAAARATETANLAISVEEQSKAWLQSMQSRKRNLVKLHTALAWKRENWTDAAHRREQTPSKVAG